MGAHHSRRDNCRVAWQEGSARKVRKAWLPENFLVAGPGCPPPPTRDSTEWLHSLSKLLWVVGHWV